MSAVWNVGWNNQQNYPQLRKNLSVDTVIIGAGITGLSTALHLLEHGQTVAILESHRVGAGTTGRSTGNLYSTLSQGLAPVRKKWDDTVLRQAVELRAAAVDQVEHWVERFNISCEFSRCPLYLCYREPSQPQRQKLEAELDAARTAGLEADLVEQVSDSPVPVAQALRIRHQAQFNPLSYIQGLAQAVADLGGLVFEDSRVCAIDASEGMVITDLGQVQASQIVQATHTPKGVNLLQAEMEVYQEYGVATRVEPGAGPIADGTFWISDDSQSLRSYHHGGDQYLVVVGEKHKTGQGELGEGYYQELQDYLQRNIQPQLASVGGQISAESWTHQWTAEQFQSADLLPYIGRSGHDNVYVATGFAADGLTWGTAAASVIADLILGRESAAAELFNPRRFTPVKSAAHWAKENATVTKHMLQDYLSPTMLKQLDQVPAGEGRLVQLDGEEVAAYRSSDNKLSVVSSVCPHMKCKVRWNAAATSWDCPCHGSRFSTDGDIIEGPALQPLSPRHLPER